MKSFISAAAIAMISIANPASAASSFDLLEIQSYAPDADLSSLSDRQVLLLLNIIHSQGREGKKYQQVRGFLLRAEGGSFLGRFFQ
jgi:hypothetical protein